jgi:hypothetical protein
MSHTHPSGNYAGVKFEHTTRSSIIHSFGVLLFQPVTNAYARCASRLQGDSALVLDALMYRRGISSKELAVAYHKASQLLAGFEHVDFQFIPRWGSRLEVAVQQQGDPGVLVVCCMHSNKPDNQYWVHGMLVCCATCNVF